ncbi:MAG TPA: glutamate--tRNA ligase [Candidatus Nanoarchaeia archaeon]|nr:glutamate--tRNA ligase [Candidatus Nanoarchaeia archaeon]
MDEGLILKYVLQNAVRYNGKANPGAIIGKVLQEKPELRAEIERVSSYINIIVKDVNTMTLEQQKEKLGMVAPELLQMVEMKHDKEERKIPELKNVHKGVVMRFAPNPNGPMSIGHCRQALWNWFFVQKYKGCYILRFDDTDPGKKYPIKEAYGWFKEDLRFLGVKPGKVVVQSKRLKIYYKYSERLLKEGNAYVCCCGVEEFRKLRNKQMECPCRNLPAEMQMERWKKMFKGYKAGGAVVRVKTNIMHNNPAVRDWPAFRIIDKSKHPLDKKTKVWPLLNFASAIDDYEFKVTHILRGIDLKISDERQKYIYSYFGWVYPETMYSGKLLFSGIKSTSEARKLISEGKLTGWDDPRLGTVKALRRRGIQKEAIINFIKDVGITPADTQISFDKLAAYNKEAIDKKANRYFAVFKPYKIKIEHAPEMVAKIPLHPGNPRKGFRVLKPGGEFYLQDKLEDDCNYRLMHLFNFRNKKFISKDVDKNLNAKMLHWLPAGKGLAKIKAVMDDNGVKEGLAEPGIKKVKLNEMVQLERNFYCRLDKKTPGMMVFYYCHD